MAWYHTSCHKHVSEYDNDVKTHRCDGGPSAIAHSSRSHMTMTEQIVGSRGGSGRYLHTGSTVDHGFGQSPRGYVQRVGDTLS